MGSYPLSARIESLAYGPHGVARVDGKVHFVRHVAPGDEVELALHEDRGAYAYADLVRLVRPGPARREAPCPYLPRCGGCPWQHVEYEAQVEAKERAVRDLLVRVGGVERPEVLPIVRAVRELGYRRRLSLRVAGRRVGFLAAASHDLVPVERCLLAAPELEGAIPLAAAWVGALGTDLSRVEIAATGDGDRVALVAQADGRFRSEDGPATEALLARSSRVAGAVLHGRGWRHAWGDDRVTVLLPGGYEMRVRAGDFTQVADAANAQLVRTVLELLAPAAHERVADLYAGAGNLSLPLAGRAARVLAVERVRTSVEAARASARRLGLENLETIAGDVPRVIAGWLARGVGVDAVVLDPPRNGAAGAVDGLVRLGAGRIVYVSCNPATLARDVRALAPVYELDRVQPIDFFPQTYHVEAIARLVRR